MALDVLDQLVRSSALDLIVIDSVAALVPRVELEGDMNDQQIGLQARLMSKALRKLTGKSIFYLIFIFFLFFNSLFSFSIYFSISISQDPFQSLRLQ